MSRGPAAAAALLALLLTGSLPAAADWVGERLCAPPLPSGAEFGSAVAVAGDGTIAVGDYRHDVVYLFRRNDVGGCEQSDTIRGRAGEWFGFDVAIDDHQLLVGAPKSGGTGAAYMVELQDGQASGLQDGHVSESQRVSGLAPRPGPGDEIGSAVAMDDGILAIGARGADDPDDRRGRVYVGSEGNLTAVPMPRDLAQRAELGQSVALSDRTLVMGAPSPFRGSGSPGAAYVVEVAPDGSPGNPVSLPLPEGLKPEAAFGYAVAVAGDLILVGAPLADATDAGVVYRFQRRNGTWQQDPAPQPFRTGGRGDQLGVAVALDEDGTAVIGARYANGTRGAAYLVGPSGGALRPRETVPAGAQFGFSVAVRDEIAVVGAFRENGTGAAYLFQLVPPVELGVATEVREVETMLSVGLRTHDGNPVARDVTLRIQTLAGTAKERAAETDEGDYLRLDREVTLHAGESTTQVGVIHLFPDNVCEERETFQVILSDPSGTRIQAVEVAIIDDDSSGRLELSPSALLHTSEDGTSAALNVHLTCRPNADVNISLSSSDDTEGAVSPDHLKFTPANWDTDQALQVTGQDDALCDGLQTYSLEVRATSADPRYAGLSQSIPAENADDERACLSAEKTVCTDAGGTVIYTISLANSLSGVPATPAELRDVLPPEVSVVTASADRGMATADPIANSVRWTGPVPAAGDAAIITIVAALDVPPGIEVRNHADVTYIRDGRGNLQTVRTNEVAFVAGDVIPCP